MVRKKEQSVQFEKEGIKSVLGDLENDISDAIKNIDRVIFAAGSGGKNVVGVDQDGAKRLIDAAKSAKVKKFVMLSSMGADAFEKASNHIQLKEKLSRRGEISRGDVAQTLVRVLNDDTANKVTFEILKGDTLIGEALEIFSEK